MNSEWKMPQSEVDLLISFKFDYKKLAVGSWYWSKKQSHAHIDDLYLSNFDYVNLITDIDLKTFI